MHRTKTLKTVNVHRQPPLIKNIEVKAWICLIEFKLYQSRSQLSFIFLCNSNHIFTSYCLTLLKCLYVRKDQDPNNFSIIFSIMHYIVTTILFCITLILTKKSCFFLANFFFLQLFFFFLKNKPETIKQFQDLIQKDINFTTRFFCDWFNDHQTQRSCSQCAMRRGRKRREGGVSDGMKSRTFTPQISQCFTRLVVRADGAGDTTRQSLAGPKR